MLENPSNTPPPSAAAPVARARPATEGAAAYRGRAADRGEPNVAHQLRFTVDRELAVTGTSHWPAQPTRGLASRTFTLRGRCDAAGHIEFVDDAPERLAGFRRGVYVGRQDPVSGRFAGQYYEKSERSHELFYWGAWTSSPQGP